MIGFPGERLRKINALPIQQIDELMNLEQHPEPRKIPKVLVHKVHGGRKQDSKFWQSEFSDSNENRDGTSNNDQIEIDNKDVRSFRGRKSSRKTVNPLWSIVWRFLLFCLVFDGGIFFYFHAIQGITVTEGIKRIQQSVRGDEQAAPYSYKIMPKENILAPAPIATRSQPQYSKEINPYPHNNTLHASAYSKVSTTGKIFSWKDKNGKWHFSNTNYPVDNDTLQVQTEINTYNRVTRIRIVSNQIYIPVILRNNSKAIKVDMLLDTGCSHTTVPYKYLNYIGAPYGSKVTSTVANGTKAHGRSARIDSLAVGSKREANMTVTGAEVAGSDNTGLLGLDFLKKNPFKIDFDNQFIVWM